MTSRQKILAGALTAALTTAAGSALAVGTYDQPVALKLTFKQHLDEGIPEQDVFIERQKGAGLVFRPTSGEHDLSKPLYAPLNPVRRAPHDAEAVGPWVRGKPLGMTLGQWLAAEGRALYRCVDGRGHFEAQFTKLVPNGVYTLRQTFKPQPATEPFTRSLSIPLGARDGSDAVFTADAKGAARVALDLESCLQLTGEQLASGLALAWHSDRKTHGALTGPVSTKSHLQLYLDLPKRSGI